MNQLQEDSLKLTGLCEDCVNSEELPACIERCNVVMGGEAANRVTECSGHSPANRG